MVTPEYALTQFSDESAKLFVGCQAVTSDHKFVSDRGTASIVHTSHLCKLPVYLFFNSLKVTHRRSDDQNINFKEDTVVGTGVEYAHLSHSHDIVDLKMIDHLITEEGEITMESIGA